MNDEKYVFIRDSREKKNVANSARNRRTHCGKGGRVRLPSDNLSKKELNAMNGECKSYKLNEPMLWHEFKSMPDDIKITYIKLIREKFGCSASGLAVMFGVSASTAAHEFKNLGIDFGKPCGKHKWDKEGFLMWCNRVPLEQAALPAVETQETVEEVVEEVVEETVEEVTEVPEIHEATVVEESKPCVPKNGSVEFEGRIEGILETVGMMLKGADVRIRVSWDVVNNG